VPKHRIILYRALEVQIHEFLTSTLNRALEQVGSVGSGEATGWTPATLTEGFVLILILFRHIKLDHDRLLLHDFQLIVR
jgi:hypothetical protein